MTLISPRMRHWAETRETAYEIALAIHSYETPQRDAEAIWAEPTPEEMAAVKAQLEPGEYYWGETRIVIESASDIEPPVHDDKVYPCVVCGKNTVDPYQGEDTCSECISRIRRDG